MLPNHPAAPTASPPVTAVAVPPPSNIRPNCAGPSKSRGSVDMAPSADSLMVVTNWWRRRLMPTRRRSATVSGIMDVVPMERDANLDTNSVGGKMRLAC